MRFEFATATRIIFGPGTLEEAAPLAAELGRRPLVVTGMGIERARSLLDALETHDLTATIFQIGGEPTTITVQEGCTAARAADCDLVIGFGGGSALDAGKAIAALLTNDGDVLDYLEVIGRGQPITRPAAPCIAIPTTAGTGAEVTRNAVLLSPEHRVKVSLRSPLLLPRLAIVDPELTYSLPPAVTASTGLDALTQLIEPFVSRRATPLTDALCREGLARAARSLRRAVEAPDPAAREDMALASLCGGLALANAGLGAVHGFAGVLGGMFDAPHGAICARLLPFVMEANLRALEAREPDNPALGRYNEIAHLLNGWLLSTAADAVAWVHDLCRALEIPPLAACGLTEADFPAVVEGASRASSMKSNPVTLTAGELTAILAQAL